MSTISNERVAPLPVLRRWMGDGRRALLGWSLALAGVAGLYLPLFPSMQSPELASLIESLPPELVRTLGYENITSGAGYTQAAFFGLVGFALLTIAAVAWGASFVGGAEESGRLELTLVHGVSRARFALESAGALLVRLAVLGAVGFLVVLALDGPSELGLDPLKLLGTCLAWVLLGAISGAAALAVGAASGRRSWGIGAGAAVAFGGYVLQALANNSEELDALRRFSPFDWAFGSTPLANGASASGLALLAGGTILLVAAGTLALNRRDVLG